MVCAGTINVGSYGMKKTFIMTLKVEPHILKIWKKFIRINYPILHIFAIYKNIIVLAAQ